MTDFIKRGHSSATAGSVNELFGRLRVTSLGLAGKRIDLNSLQTHSRVNSTFQNLWQKKSDLLVLVAWGQTWRAD